MLKFYLSASDGGPIVNKIAFYTPTANGTGFEVGDTVDIQFIQDYSLNETEITSSVISASNTHYLVFDISGSDLPQYGGLFTVNLINSFPWEEVDYDWELADWNWEDTFPVTTYDTERGTILEFIPTSSFTGSFETASYTTHSFDYEAKYFTGSFETASYFTASLAVSGADAYISVREQGTYTVYRGY